MWQLERRNPDFLLRWMAWFEFRDIYTERRYRPGFAAMNYYRNITLAAATNPAPRGVRFYHAVAAMRLYDYPEEHTA